MSDVLDLLKGSLANRWGLVFAIGVVALIDWKMNQRTVLLSRTIVVCIVSHVATFVFERIEAFGLAFGSGPWRAVALAALALGVTLAATTLYLAFERQKKSRRIEGQRFASKPMEWHQIFRSEHKQVILHMKDGRQILGWPEGWPRSPSDGYFFLTNARPLGALILGERLQPWTAVVLPMADVSWIRLVDAKEAQDFN